MKKIAVLILMLVIYTSGFNQQTNIKSSLTKTDYLKKSKKQKATAWVLLGTGALLDIVSAIAAPKHASSFYYDPGTQSSSSNTGAILIVAGTATMLGSIPLFIAASSNRNKAVSLSFKNEIVPQFKNYSSVHTAVPSISIKIGI